MASPQSHVIHDDYDLVRQIQELDERYADQPIPRPMNWGGYRMTPTVMEFWQGRPSRLHDRFRYRRENLTTSSWTLERLAP
jgi:pyridoxamine 5'-phosphate oxidase